MPIYTSSLATAGTVTGNAANTESPGTWSLKTASQGRNIYLERMDVVGRASALTNGANCSGTTRTASTNRPETANPLARACP